MRITWRMLTRKEPRLAKLAEEIRALPRPKPGEPYCANAVWYQPPPIDDADAPYYSYKERMSRLVGWDRRGDPVLGTMEAYDVAYAKLYGLLPDCQHDGLCWG